MTYLLDVNVLIALCDPQHVHHAACHRWFKARGKKSWATCPITENGFVRIFCNPSYPNRLADAATALDLLKEFCSAPGHKFLEDSVTIRSCTDAANLSHRVITDLYLLALCKKANARLATLDQNIPADGIPDGSRHLELIQAAGK